MGFSNSKHLLQTAIKQTWQKVQKPQEGNKHHARTPSKHHNVLVETPI